MRKQSSAIIQGGPQTRSNRSTIQECKLSERKTIKPRVLTEKNNCCLRATETKSDEQFKDISDNSTSQSESTNPSRRHSASDDSELLRGPLPSVATPRRLNKNCSKISSVLGVASSKLVRKFKKSPSQAKQVITKSKGKKLSQIHTDHCATDNMLIVTTPTKKPAATAQTPGSLDAIVRHPLRSVEAREDCINPVSRILWGKEDDLDESGYSTTKEEDTVFSKRPPVAFRVVSPLQQQQQQQQQSFSKNSPTSTLLARPMPVRPMLFA